MDWLGGNKSVLVWEEIVGLGRYGKTLPFCRRPQSDRKTGMKTPKKMMRALLRDGHLGFTGKRAGKEAQLNPPFVCGTPQGDCNQSGGKGFAM